MNHRYPDVTESLRIAYDGAVEHRDRMEKAPWKISERAGFLRRLRDENCRRLLELGAGTGQDSAFFAGQGLRVVATDLSPEMVARCRAKGLDARVMDFLHLDFPAESFDAVYALNCLLHVPNADLPAVLEVIASVLRPGGLFFLGVYGHDQAEEGPFEDGVHHPPRFFSWRTDEQIQRFARRRFEIVDFHVVGPGREHFQSLTLRR
jgi:SAM-dependent methyltransferase